jgi:hypothetical protein
MLVYFAGNFVIVTQGGTYYNKKGNQLLWGGGFQGIQFIVGTTQQNICNIIDYVLSYND